MRTLESWLEYISVQNWQTIDMGLSRMQTMVERLALSRPAPRVITVAGTNGKGSTSMACEALLQSQGFRVGTTLSPHVRRFNERVRINAEEASDEIICRALTVVEEHRDDLPLTYFEYSALAALWCFKQARVDVAILEIGLGGRLDAFNVVDADVAVITSIGLDHQQLLGNSRQAIGIEKAGILRRGQHVALGPEMPDSVLQACTALDLKPIYLGDNIDLAVTAATATDPASWSIMKSGRQTVAGIPMGQCAPQNLLLAYLAVQGLGEVPLDAVVEVAQTLNMPGRLQTVWRKQRRWILDVAHNPAGAHFLCEQLTMRDLSPRIIVCGMLRDKAHKAVFEAISAHLNAPWLLVDTQGERALSAIGLAGELSLDDLGCCTWAELEQEVNSATQPGDVILLFGSFSVIEQFEH